MTRADKNLIDRTVTAAMPIWSHVLYQVACLDKKWSPDHISSHLLAWTDAGRPQNRVEAGSVRPLPCPGADRQPTPSAWPISDPDRLRLDI
jgi:hypothetical protein